MGERLVETRLAEELAMSRAPVREALQRLVKERLVEETPHHGTFVTALSAANITDLYNVRLGLEVTALRLFMGREASTAPLWQAIGRMEHAAAGQDMQGVVRAELGFHRCIVEQSGNAVLSELYTDLEGRLLMVLALDDASFERLQDVAAEHVPVVEAIEHRDELHAVTVFEEHLVSTVDEVLDRMGGDGTALLPPLRAGSQAASARRTRGGPAISTSTDGRHSRAGGTRAGQDAAQRAKPPRMRKPAAAARSKARPPRAGAARTPATRSDED